MRFLVDAQLPRRTTKWFAEAACDAVHTLDLRLGNRTTDAIILATCERDERVLVTKDADFVSEYLLHGRPRKLLLVSVGNLGNRELEALFVRSMPDLSRTLIEADFVELRRSGLIIRG